MKIEKCKLQNKDQYSTPAGATLPRRRWTRLPRLLQFAFFIFQFSVFNLSCAPTLAGYDDDAQKPYKVQLVLRFAEHKQLTPAFKDKVERELLNSLQGALGEMGEVEVVHEHAKLKEIEEKGLERALDSWHDLTGVKTQFVLIGVKDGEFEVLARQHDGYTGLASYYRKPERVSDRQLVARTAALLIDRDFGAGGLVEVIDALSARIHFRAAGLDGALERWVKKGDVFALVQIDGSQGQERVTRHRWIFLQAREEPKDGNCLCSILQGESKPLPAAKAYRCMKLGTTRGPLHIQVVKAGASRLTPERDLQIHVRKKGFKQDETPEQGATDVQGYFNTDQRKISYDQVAFVSCVVSNSVRAQFPVPIYDQGVTVCPVALSKDDQIQLALDQRLWENGMYETDLRQGRLFRELSKADPENRQATLEKAKKGLDALNADLDLIDGKRRDLLQRKMAPAAGEDRLKDLREKRDKLKTFVANQEDIIRSENDPSRKEILELINQAQFLEGQAEFGKALKVYDQVLEKVKIAGLKDPKLNDYVAHVNQLKTNWDTKGPDHEYARKFIYETWPDLDTEDLQRGVGEARKALEACRKAGDRLSPQKLAKVALAHQGKLNQKRSELNPDLNVDDVKTAQSIEAVLDDLAKLLKEVNDVLKQSAPAK
jgi:hypothetical protein